jgi:hypothetical protein
MRRRATRTSRVKPGRVRALCRFALLLSGETPPAVSGYGWALRPPVKGGLVGLEYVDE